MPSTDPAPQRRIVVGFDGSASSKLALQRAADEARPGDCVFVVHAFELPSDLLGRVEYDRAVAFRRGEAQRILDGIDVDFAGAEVEIELIGGPAAEAIEVVAEARAATEIIVGSRGAGRVLALLGSVSHALISRATCPVVVIPERAVEAQQAIAAAERSAAA